MRSHSICLGAALLCVAASAPPVAAGPQQGVGPHDVPTRAADVAAYWLPRHRAVIDTMRPFPSLPARAAAKRKKFTKPVRVSADLLGPPDPMALPTAQAETQTEPYLAVDPNDPDHLLAGWQEHRFSDGGARALGYAVSHDAGKSWSEGRVPGLTTVDGGPWPRASDPWPAFGPKGRAYFVSLLVVGVGSDNAIAVSASDDGGTTWGDPVQVVRDSTNFNDKEAIVVDTFPSSRHFGNVYVAWDVNVAVGGSFTAQRLVVSRSTSRGRRWRQPVRLRSGFTNIGVIPRVGPDGTVYAVWASAERGDANLSLLFSRSTDGGKSWTSPRKIADMLGIGVARFRSGTILPSFDVDPSDGTLLAAWADARFSGVDQAAVIRSTDGGDTWSSPARASDGPANAPVFTVGIAAGGNGHVAVGYYTLRNDTGTGTHVDYYVNRSKDAGVAFGKGVRVTRRSFDAQAAARAGQSSSLFLGDYAGLAGTGDRLYALFTGVYKKSQLRPGKQPDIFAARSR